MKYLLGNTSLGILWQRLVPLDATLPPRYLISLHDLHDFIYRSNELGIWYFRLTEIPHETKPDPNKITMCYITMCTRPIDGSALFTTSIRSNDKVISDIAPTLCFMPRPNHRCVDWNELA